MNNSSPDIMNLIYNFDEPNLEDNMEKYDESKNICNLFLLGQCYNKYCPYNHYKKKGNIYIIPGTDYVSLEKPNYIDPKYDRLEKEKTMTELEKFRNKLIYSAKSTYKEAQLRKKKDFYIDKLKTSIPNLNIEDEYLLNRIFPKKFNSTDILENKLGLASSYNAAKANSIDWEREKLQLEQKL